MMIGFIAEVMAAFMGLAAIIATACIILAAIYEGRV